MKRLLAVYILAGFIMSGCSILEGTPLQGTFLDTALKGAEKKFFSTKIPDKPEEALKEYLTLRKDKKYKKALKYYALEFQTEEQSKYLEGDPLDYNTVEINEIQTDPTNKDSIIIFKLDDKEPWAATFTKEDGVWKLKYIDINPYG